MTGRKPAAVREEFPEDLPDLSRHLGASPDLGDDDGPTSALAGLDLTDVLGESADDLHTFDFLDVWASPQPLTPPPGRVLLSVTNRDGWRVVAPFTPEAAARRLSTDKRARLARL